MSAPPRRAASAAESSDDESESIGLPPQLLARLVQEYKEDKSVRTSQAALNTLGEYMKTFIREAIWRSAAQRKGVENPITKVPGGSRFMEVRLCLACGMREVGGTC